ncbi:MAG: radical SAM protein [Dehalococcoidia bacterium]|jgi:wyosine [tRNA(Phe)-imidazoG37] synthetase (radical SAM superfamily)
MSIIYGPVPSWRLGRSLGIDMVSTRLKTCSFDCVYCQLGSTLNRQAARKEFVSLKSLEHELGSLPPIEADYATFSGVGEPALASNIGEAIEMARRSLSIPIAVLTNSSLLYQQHVREELAGADMVVAKLDAPDDDLLHVINRPVFSLSFHRLIEGIRSFRSIFDGKLALQLMFMQTNRRKGPQLAELVKALDPDEIQINTPLRPCPVKPLNRSELSQIRRDFSGFKHVIDVYQAAKPAVLPLNQQQTKRRRPQA